MSSLKSTALMFLALLASYIFEFAVILLLPRSPNTTNFLLLMPVILAQSSSLNCATFSVITAVSSCIANSLSRSGS